MTDHIYDLSFSRNIGILTEAEQQQLARSTVAIAGLGGIGGNTLVLLARMGVGHFRLTDFDRFDHININRQYGARVDTIGRPKCDVLAEEVRRINPSATLEIFPEGFIEADTTALLENADLVVDAIDFYAIETHLQFHQATRQHGLYTLMGSPVGFSACLQVFDPHGMSLEEYCGIQPDMTPLEKQLRYACGLVPELAHIEYYDVSVGSSNTDFLNGTGPSLASACALAAALVATEAVLILLKRRQPRAIPHTFQFDPYTFRYHKTLIDGGMTNYDPDPVLADIPDKSSLVAQVFELFYKKTKAEKAHVNGAQLYFKVEGSGENVLFISPLGGDSSFWVRQTQELARHFRVLTFDGRGSGTSSPWPSECSTELLADDTIALLDYLGVKRTHIVGLALGGLIAQHVAIKRPDLVDRLVLVSSYAKADDCVQDVTGQWRHVAIQQGMDMLFDTCLPWLFSPQYIENNQGELDKLKTFYRLTLQDPQSFCQQSLAGMRHDSCAILHQIRCPALIIHGGGDRLVNPKMAKSLAQDLPNSRLLELEQAPHFLIWEHARSFNAAVLDFLNSS